MNIALCPALAALVACGPAVDGEGELEGEARAGIELGGDSARVALVRGDRATFVLELQDQLAAMHEWATIFDRDLATASPPPDEEVTRAFRAWREEHARVRTQLHGLQLQRDFVSDQARALLDRVMRLETEARRIDDLRQPTQDATR